MAGQRGADSEGEVLPPRKGRSGAIDVISALHRHDGRFAAREQKVADYVKAHLEDVSGMTIAELAGESGVSTPTVVRFCRTLGVDGYREFKLRLAQNIAVSMQYLAPEMEAGGSGAHAAIDQVMSGVFATATMVRQQIDMTAFEAAKRALLGASQLLFAGVGGGSSMLAAEGANRFFRLGKPAFSVSDSYVLQMRAATLKPDDVLFLISASGEADAIVGAAEIANSYGGTTIALTKPGTRLERVADIAIALDPPEDRNVFKPTASRYIHLIVIDALALAVAQETPRDTSENLRRIRASLTAYHGRTGPQPLGD